MEQREYEVREGKVDLIDRNALMDKIAQEDNTVTAYDILMMILDAPRVEGKSNG